MVSYKNPKSTVLVLINLKTSLWEIFRLYSLAKLSGLWKEISC